jgi:probable phosphoglycerate mutase
MAEIWLIRHGETEWSRSGAHTGRTDIPLTEAGRREAVAIGRYLAGHAFALVLTSPLQRALETCRLAGFAPHAETDPNLREWDYGDYEGRTTQGIRREAPGWSVWTCGPKNGETIGEVAQRTESVLARTEQAEGDVALFSHAHFLRILTACWLGLPPDCGRLFPLGTASLGVLGYERETRVISRWNLSVSAQPG